MLVVAGPGGVSCAAAGGEHQNPMRNDFCKPNHHSIDEGQCRTQHQRATPIKVPDWLKNKLALPP
jgi:hypothetical protein